MTLYPHLEYLWLLQQVLWAHQEQLFADGSLPPDTMEEINGLQLAARHEAGVLFLNGVRLQASGQFDAALVRLNQSLDLLHGTTVFCSEEVASAIYNMATIYLHQSRLDDALELFGQALVIYRVIGAAKHTADCLHKGATIFMRQGLYDQALNFFGDALELYHQTVGINSMEVAEALSNMALVFTKKGRFDVAVELLSEVRMIYKAIGASPNDTASLLNNLAIIYQKQGRYEPALDMFQRSLSIYQRDFAHNVKEVASTLHNIASILMKQERYPEAFQMFSQSFDIHKQSIGLNTSEAATTLNNIAFLHLYQRQYDQARVVFQQSLDINLAVFGSRSYRTHSTALALHRTILLARLDGRIDLSPNDMLESLNLDREIIQSKPLSSLMYSLDRHIDLIDTMSRMMLASNRAPDACNLWIEEADLMIDKQLSAIALKCIRHAISLSWFIDPETEDGCSWRIRALLAASRLFEQSQMFYKSLEMLERARPFIPTLPSGHPLQGKVEQSLDRVSALVNQQRALIPDQHEDLRFELSLIHHLKLEVQLLTIEDLAGDRHEMLNRAENLTNEIITSMLHVLDQCYGRLVRSIGADKDVYFPIEESRDDLRNSLNSLVPASLWKPKWIDPNDLHFLLKDIGLIDTNNSNNRKEWKWNGTTPIKETLLMNLPSCYESKIDDIREWLESSRSSKYLPIGQRMDQIVKAIDMNQVNVYRQQVIQSMVDNRAVEKVTDEDGYRLLSSNFDFSSLDVDSPPDWWMEHSSTPPLARKMYWREIAPALQSHHHRCRTLDDVAPTSWQAIVAHQPFSFFDSGSLGESWAEKLYDIANNNKHVRLTPLSSEGDLSREEGLVRERCTSMLIDITPPLPVIKSWSLMGLMIGANSRLEAPLSNEQLVVLSAEARDMLAGRGEFESLKDKYFSLTRLNELLKYYVPSREMLAIVRNTDRDSQERADAWRALDALIDSDIARWQEKGLGRFGNEIKEFVRRRIERFDPGRTSADAEPDDRVDVDDLIARSITNIEHLVSTMLADVVRLSAPLGPTTSCSSMTLQPVQATASTTMQVMTSMAEIAYRLKHYQSIKQRNPRASIELLVELSRDVREHHPWLASRLLVKASNLMSRIGDLDHALQSVKMLFDASEIEFNQGRLYRSLRLLQMAVDQSRYCPLADGHPLKLDSSRHHESDKRTLGIIARQGNLDSDLYSQLCYCFEMLDECRFRSISILDTTASADSTSSSHSRKREKQVHLSCRLTSIAIKARHLLDQALTRFMHRCIACPRDKAILQAQVPLARGRGWLVSKLNEILTNNDIRDVAIEQSFPEVFDAIVAIQPYSILAQARQAARQRSTTTNVDDTTASGFFEQVYLLSNEAKHERIRTPSSHEIDRWFAEAPRDVGEWPVEIKTKIEIENAPAAAPARAASSKKGAKAGSAPAKAKRDAQPVVPHAEQPATRLEAGVALLTRALGTIEDLMRLMAQQQPLQPHDIESESMSSGSSASE